MRTLAVLASGNGTNFEALALAADRGELGGAIALLASDRADAPVLRTRAPPRNRSRDAARPALSHAARGRKARGSQH
jgi:folate-dependent phosphoribosylglycinamide formyltransferase PurN